MAGKTGEPGEATEHAPAAGPAVWDKPALLDRLMADESLAGVIVAGFLGDIPAQIEKLERFLQHHGMEGVERQAHSIKGAAANVGGEAVREIALKIEAAGRVADAAAAEAGMDELRRRFAALAEAIRFDAGRRG